MNHLMELTALALCEAAEQAQFDAALAAGMIQMHGPTPAWQARLQGALDTLELCDRPEKWLTVQVAAWCDEDGVVRSDRAVLVGVA
jgi:hypothetical protein